MSCLPPLLRGLWPSLSVGLASSLSSLSSGARTQVAVSGRLLGRAPQAGGGGGGGGSAQLVNKGRLGAGRAPSGFNAQWPEGLAASLLADICIASGAGTGARSIGDCEAAVSKKKRPVLKARLAYCDANSIQSRPARAGLPGAPASRKPSSQPRRLLLLVPALSEAKGWHWQWGRGARSRGLSPHLTI